MEVNVSGFNFFSTFDSGNLASVEAIPAESHPLLDCPYVSSVEEIPAEKGSPLTPVDYSFRIWTRPDCSGTEFENGNRTWFYFGFRGDATLRQNLDDSLPTVRFTVMNLNKQSKLFSQGMAPIALVIPSSQRPDKLKQQHCWERIRDKPTYWTINNESNNATDKQQQHFVVSFRIKCDPKATTYLAFTYPYSYKELQMYMNKLERKYSNDAQFSHIQSIDEKSPTSKIYFHRELVVRSLLNFRIDLLTITDSNGMTPEREHVLENLFPEHPHVQRPRLFKGKKVVFVSARVHPGETQSSFVINGFIKFLLRENDARAETLRRKYVFKLMPMLNPDGVVHGHYRTDSRGVNLNRVYGSPSLELHPPIYAAKKLLLYAHHRKEILDEIKPDEKIEETNDEESKTEDNSESTPTRLEIKINTEGEKSHWLRSCLNDSANVSLNSLASSSRTSAANAHPGWYEMTETSRCSEGDESIADFSVFNERPKTAGFNAAVTAMGGSASLTSFAGAFGTPSFTSALIGDNLPPTTTSGFCQAKSPKHSETSNGSSTTLGEVVSSEENANLDFPANVSAGKARLLNETVQQQTDDRVTPVKHSGVFMYVDIHGHASKRGIFMYGNHFPEMDHQVGCMLLPKLMSINCAHFDFPACVFTERNMYLKDRHTGAGREGSGRVSAFKATGLLYAYTLECNFNTGRLVNGIPMASRDCGRATPPPKFDHPPKYDQEVYEESGKALAIAILDLTESNPWTRLTCSAHKNLRGVRDWLKKYIKAKAEEEAEKAAKQANSSPSKSSSVSSSSSRPVRSTARRVRTFSASSVTSTNSNKKKILASTNSASSSSTTNPSSTAPPSKSSPESYRPVSKLARKNSIQVVPNNSPIRGRKLTSTPMKRSASSKSRQRPSTAAIVQDSSVRGRSQSQVILPSRSRSRPSSPQAKRPPSRAGEVSGHKTPSKKSRAKSASSAGKSSIILPPLNAAKNETEKKITPASPFKKKPLKRILRRQRKAANADSSGGSLNQTDDT